MRKTSIALSLIVAATVSVLSAASSDETDLMAAMNTYKDALIHKDGAVLDRILSPDLLYTHSGGQFETKKDVVSSITGAKTIIQKVQFSDTTIHVYGDTALVKARVDLWHSDTEIVHMSVLHVWVKRAGGWQMVARQATKLPA